MKTIMERTELKAIMVAVYAGARAIMAAVFAGAIVVASLARSSWLGFG